MKAKVILEQIHYQDYLLNEDEYCQDNVIEIIQTNKEAKYVLIINLNNNSLIDKQLDDENIQWIYDLKINHGLEKPIINYFKISDQSNYYKEYDNIEMNNNTIYRKYTDKNGEMINQLVIPKSMINVILEVIHDSVCSGHLGRDKTWQKVKQRFYWPNSKDSVEKYVKECLSCQQIKIRPHCTAPLKPIRPYAPLELITVDITGRLPTTSLNNKYIIVICDHFSKFTVCFPMKDQLANTVADILMNYFCMMGLPSSILIYQGRNFQSLLLE